MSVMITCPACQRSMKAPDTVIGRTVKCPACQTQFAVTGGPPPEPGPAAAPLAGIDEEGTPRRRSGAGWFQEFLLFRRMIAPIVIQFLFWIGTIVFVIVGLLLAVLSLTQLGQHAGEALTGMLLGLAYAVGGPIVLRLYCETLIIFFRMYETMKDVKDGIDRLRKD